MGVKGVTYVFAPLTLNDALVVCINPQNDAYFLCLIFENDAILGENRL